jgi:hypothetical protein
MQIFDNEVVAHPLILGYTTKTLQSTGPLSERLRKKDFRDGRDTADPQGDPLNTEKQFDAIK